ncbi:Leukocyte-associated immunoglobulin-like receptor 1 [Tupaia chinensis]|nr:Leukocyte-associated immunoglobulin-like receptor 1 [Tupaia chinensis]
MRPVRPRTRLLTRVRWVGFSEPIATCGHGSGQCKEAISTTRRVLLGRAVPTERVRESWGPTQTPVHDSGHGGLKPEYLPAVLGVSAVFLLGLLLLGLVLLHRKHQKKSGPPGRRDEEQRPQQRPRPAADVPAPERTPEVATVDRLPETDRQTDTPVKSPEEVTYAQLDHKVLTQGAALAVSPQSREPTTEFSTYAALSRR